jgi:hypothetical protein
MVGSSSASEAEIAENREERVLCGVRAVTLLRNWTRDSEEEGTRGLFAKKGGQRNEIIAAFIMVILCALNLCLKNECSNLLTFNVLTF